MNFFRPREERRAPAVQYSALFSYTFFIGALIFSLNLLKLSLPGILGFASDITVDEVLNLTNQRRQGSGAGALRLDPTLSAAAQQKANHMFANNYWAHVAPDGTDPWHFIVGVGYDYLYAGENLAKDFSHSSGVVDAWMNSPTHRENLLNSRYEDIGLAVVNGTLNGVETTLVVQMFGKKKVSAQLAAIEPELEITPPPPPPQVPPATIEPQPPAVPATVEGPKEELAQLSRPPGGLRIGVPLTLASGGSSSRPLIDIGSFSKVTSVLMGGFVASVFAVDSWVARRRFYYRLSGHTFAHLGLLILALFGVWFTNTGSIL